MHEQFWVIKHQEKKRKKTSIDLSCYFDTLVVKDTAGVTEPCQPCTQRDTNLNLTPDWHLAKTIPLLRVGQGFLVYGIQALFKSGIRYISAEIWVFGISHFLNFRCTVYCIA